MIELTTSRLLLRQFRPDDLDRYAAMCSDLEVMRYVGYGQPMSRQESWRNMAMLLGHWQLHGYGLFAVEEKDSGQLVGRVGIFNPDGWPGEELGWMLAREHWGKGYAFEAAWAVRDWAFNDLGMDTLISIIHPQNKRSITLAEHLGEEFDRPISVQGIEALCYSTHRHQYQ